MGRGFSPGYSVVVRLAPQHLRTFMITCVTNRRRRLFQTEQNAGLTCETLQTYRLQGQFHLHAFVIMPDHVHVLLTPAPEISLEKTVQLMKGGFSFRLRANHSVWERGRFDRRIADSRDYAACVAYIHHNPVRAALVQVDEQFAFSSAFKTDHVDPEPEFVSCTTRAKALRAAPEKTAG